MTSLKIKFMTRIIGFREKQSSSNRGIDEVMEIKFNVKLVFKVQKQSFADVSQNRRSEKYLKSHKKTPVLESLLNKVAGSHAFLKRDSSTGVFP